MASNISTIPWDIAVGDKLLQSVAKRLRDCVRDPDTVSRQGGDEFVVLLQDVHEPEDAAATARRILSAVANVHSVDDHDLHVTASIGVSLYPDDGLDAETLIKNADTAMYQAKETGSHSYRFFKPAMNARAVQRQSLERGPAASPGAARIHAALPAQNQSEDRRDYRRGSADALDASQARS